MSDYPTGTITFLFTDIEGSTKLWETQPGAMRLSLERHDALLRAAIGACGGTVFKTIGDAFCAAFADAPSALAAALDAQTALLAHPWPPETPICVRMALHTGLAQERDNDYFGPVLNRVERVMSSGHGGQILVSAAACELVRDALPDAAGLADLGSHPLKDLDRPEHIFQLTHPALPAPEAFPPLRTLDNTPNNLPTQVTSFIGREKAISEVRMRLAKTRLLTLTGAGGSGKTRLALQVAADVLDHYPDGAWLVELAPLGDAALVPQTIAQVLGVKEQAGQTLAQTLAEQLKPKNLLLVLDNCEHLLQACAGLVAAIIRACPDVRVLATGREPLGIAGEAIYRVPSLSLPNSQQRKTATPESVNQFEAVRLFLDRAELVKSDFAVTNANAPALAQLCFRVDGIPLAIELAAARVRSLSVEDINTRLDQRFRLLTGGDKSALPRQQTLRALVDWSFDLLSETEKTLLARLSVFAGGWSLAAAESVCAGAAASPGFDPIEDWEILDVLTSLVDKSLIAAEEEAGAVRYRLLETIRQYAAEKRAGSGETTRLQSRHGAYFAGLAEEAEPHLRGATQAEWLNRLETEHDNLRAALTWCASDAESDAKSDAEEDRAAQGVRLAGALWRFWYVRGYLSEGREQIERALQGETTGGETADGEARARALRGAGFLALSQNEYAAAGRWLGAALSLSRALGSRPGIALALNYLGNLAIAQGDYAAGRSLYEESLALRRALGDRSGVANSLLHLGGVAGRQGDYDAARSLYEESLAAFREVGEPLSIAHALLNLANLAVSCGDYLSAQSLHNECLAAFRELGDKSGVAYSLNDLGEIAYSQGDYDGARQRFAESLALFTDLGDKSGLASSRHNLGLAALGAGDPVLARQQFGESLALFRDVGERKGIACALEGFAAVRLFAKAFHEAAVLFGAGAALRDGGTPLTPGEQAEYQIWWEEARSHLGEEAFTRAWETGRALPLEQAIDRALGAEGG